MTYSYSSTPLMVSEGDYVQFRFKALDQWDKTLTVKVEIGDLVQYWYITTIPEDFSPDPYPFQEIPDDPGAELETLYTYADGSRAGENLVVVSGLTATTQAPISVGCNISGGIDQYAMRIDYNGDGTWDTNWIQGNGTETVENGAKIQIRGKTSGFVFDQTRVTLNIGTASEVWRINTKPLPLNKPEPFPDFTDLTGQPPNTYCYSNIVRIQGLTTSASLFISNNAEWAKSASNNTSTNDDGFQVLSGATFTGSSGTVSNGDYIQLRLLSSSNSFAALNTSLVIGDGGSPNPWEVETGDIPSTTPNSFFFPDKDDVLEDTLIASDSRVVTGLGSDVTVSATLIGTSADLVRVKINNGSIGLFPAELQNNDVITIYMQSSAGYLESDSMTIKVGDLQVATWTIRTNAGPDYDATFSPPNNKTSQVPNTYVTSAPVVVGGINRPITITATNGALISIDFDTPVAGPRTFDPSVNTSFSVTVLTATNLATPKNTTVVVGTEASNVSAVTFTWTATTYATVPLPATNLGVWYSKKTEKFDGFGIGTVIPILMEQIGDYGDLGGNLGSRYASWLECNGQSLDAGQYRYLYEIIKTHYGGNVTETFDSNGVATYTGNFNLPDYRNRRICGIGSVDSSRGNSAFLDVAAGTTGNINTPGSYGGYWYFDRVSVAGSNPLEQIESGGELDTQGLSSQFFSLGTLRIAGLETITDTVTFTIAGSVTAQVGPLSEASVRVPEHEHSYISAVIDDAGAPLIPWGTRALFGNTGRVPSGINQYSDFFNDSIFSPNTLMKNKEPTQDNYEDAWNSWISANLSNFAEEIARTDPAFTDLKTWIGNNLPTSGGTLITNSDDRSFAYASQRFMLWWPSLRGVLDSAPLQGSYSVTPTNNVMAAMIDTNPSTFTFSASTSVSGTTNTHSHIITENIVGNPQTDFTGGNVSGPGLGGSYGGGLGGSNTGSSLLVTFDQSELFMDMTGGTFEFTSSFKKPIPDVTMQPQRQVPILNPFHKAKYIIKAY